MKTCGFLLSVLALAGCCAQPVIPVPETIKVPVVVPCVQVKPVKPGFALDSLSEAATDYDLVMSLWLERIQRIEYEGRLEAALTGCE